MPITICETESDCVPLLGSHDEAVIVVPVYNNYDDFARCFDSIQRNTSSNIDLVVVDDCGDDRRFLRLLEKLMTDRRIIILKMSKNSGFVGACNSAIAATGERDLIFVNSDVVVGPEWYERLRSAAKSSNVIATVSTLTNHGTMLSAPSRNLPSRTLDNSNSLDDFIREIARNSLCLRPTIPTAVGHCFYVKRAALNVCGNFSDDFGKGYGEEVDLSQRMIKAGFRHICADDVFVFHRGGGSFGSDRDFLQRKNDLLIRARYPFYEKTIEEWTASQSNQLALALRTIEIKVKGLSVAIDGRCLGPIYMGTQQVVVETARALSKHEDVSDLRVFVSENISPATLEKLVVNRKTRVCYPSNAPEVPADIAYRPYQAASVDDLAFLRHIGNRAIVNQLDLIAYFNPFYFDRYQSWAEYRKTTSEILRLVDGVAFISNTARLETVREGLVNPVLPLKTVYCGTDLVPISGARRPSGLWSGKDNRFILTIGAAYEHKNRLLSIRLLEQLRKRGWDGFLVLAGATPPDGNSLGSEAECLIKQSELSEFVINLGVVSDEERRWLFENSELVVYLSTVEGFGFVPFEAAGYGTPCLTSRGGSLAEVLPVDLETVDDFNVSRAGDLAWRLINDRTFADRQLQILATHRNTYSWDKTAASLMDLFEEVIRRPPILEISRIRQLEADLRRSGDIVKQLEESVDLAEEGRRHFEGEVARLEQINHTLNQANTALNRANTQLHQSNSNLIAFNERLLLGDRSGTWRRWLSWPARRFFRRMRGVFTRPKSNLRSVISREVGTDE